MKIIADTNILVRAAVLDNAEESRLAINVLEEAQSIIIPLTVLCEFVWVLARCYKRSAHDIAVAIQNLLDIATIKTNIPAIKAGLDQLRAGGNFADGVIAFEGYRLGGDVFATFDRKAATLLGKNNKNVYLLEVTQNRNIP